MRSSDHLFTAKEVKSFTTLEYAHSTTKRSVRDRKNQDHPLVKLFTDPDEFLARLAREAGELLEAVTPWIVLVVVVLSLLAAATVARRVRRAGRWADGARRVKILAPPEVAASGVLTLWMGLHAILRPAWRRVLFGQPHLAWEVVADLDELAISLWVPNVIPPGLVERAVESAWPGARTEPELERPLFPEPGSIAITELALAEPEWFPIGEAPDTEPLRLALGTMTTLEPGERAVTGSCAAGDQLCSVPDAESGAEAAASAQRHDTTPFWASGSSHGKLARVARPSMDPPSIRTSEPSSPSRPPRCGTRR